MDVCLTTLTRSYCQVAHESSPREVDVSSFFILVDREIGVKGNDYRILPRSHRYAIFSNRSTDRVQERIAREKDYRLSSSWKVSREGANVAR